MKRPQWIKEKNHTHSAYRLNGIKPQIDVQLYFWKSVEALIEIIINYNMVAL